MIRGFYTAVSDVVSAMTRQAVVADNIANSNTVGFSVGTAREPRPCHPPTSNSNNDACWVDRRRRDRVRASQR
jgi:hypothetical protein